MNKETLIQNAQALVAPGKGILAADESTGTAGKRLDTVGLENTEENRRQYRQIFLTTPNIGETLGGVILFEETISQLTDNGTAFTDVLYSQNILPGIKVDKGVVPMSNFPDESITEGVEGLRARLEEYAKQGMKFAKYRSVLLIGAEKGLPTDRCIESNAEVMARYAALCQEFDIVPVIEPEVLYDRGDHTLEVAEAATTRTLTANFEAMKSHRVLLEGLILKSSMVLASKDHNTQSTPSEVAEATLRSFKASVPETVPGIVFLSGGQTASQVNENMNEINASGAHPWQISFSFGRGLQSEVLEVWGGKSENLDKAQAKFTQSLLNTKRAREGTLKLEKVDA